MSTLVSVLLSLVACMTVCLAAPPEPNCTYSIWTSSPDCRGNPDLSVSVPPRTCATFPNALGSWQVVLDGDHPRVDQFTGGMCKDKPYIEERLDRAGSCVKEGTASSVMVKVANPPYKPQKYHLFWWSNSQQCQGRYVFNDVLSVERCTRVNGNTTVTITNVEYEGYAMMREWTQDPDLKCSGKPDYILGTSGGYCMDDRLGNSYNWAPVS